MQKEATSSMCSSFIHANTGSAGKSRDGMKHGANRKQHQKAYPKPDPTRSPLPQFNSSIGITTMPRPS
jgi:hypothetical protein